MVTSIDIRQLADDGPAVLGELIVTAQVIRVDTTHAALVVDAQLPVSFAFPEQPIRVALYADGVYFGHGLLDCDGFRANSNFKIEFATSQTPAPGAC